MLMLSVGLRTDRALFHELRARGPLLARALVIVWLIVPMLALTVLYALRPPQFVAITLMVMAICPGVPLVLRKSQKAQGDPRMSLLLVIASALTAMFCVPLWATLLSRTTQVDISLAPLDVVKVVVPIVLAPYVVGRLINELSPRVARVLAKVADGLFIAGFVVIALALIIRRVPSFDALTLRGLVAAVIISLGAAALGYVSATATLANRISVGYGAALGNPALALAVMAHVSQVHDQPAAIALVVAFVLVRVLALIPFSIWLKRRRHRDDGRTAPIHLSHAHGV